MAARPSVLTCGLALALAAAACIHSGGRRLSPFGKIEVEQERELGFRFDREIHEHLPFIDDLLVLEFVDGLGQGIVRGLEPQPFLYRFRVIQDPTLNAFAVPGGYIYLHSGTLLAVSSLEELAGVVGHEVAHVKARHYARLQERAAIPDLLTGIAAIAAGVAASDPTAGVVVQAANEALKLRFTREYEEEADRFGATFMVRAGYDPQGVVRFFERLVLEKRRRPLRIPPYLYSHPQVEDRIAAVSRLAEGMRPLQAPPADLEARLPRIQARLAYLLEEGRSRRSLTAPFDRAAAEPQLTRADEHAARGEALAALQTLEEAEQLEPNDPRVPFRRGQILEEEGRSHEAIAAYHRTLELDPSRALVFHKLGRLYKLTGRRTRAAFFFEQAVRRAGPDGGLREQAEWELAKVTFPILIEVGLRAAPRAEVTRGETAPPPDVFGPDDRGALWWGRLGPRFVAHSGKLRIRWIDPSGATVKENELERSEGAIVTSVLPLNGLFPARVGTWTVEVRLDDDIVDRRHFRLAM
jgi:predicted Zn-dependent protease